MLAVALSTPACISESSQSSSSSLKPITLGTQTQLMVDDLVIETRTGVSRRLHPLTKHPANPILRPDRPWEDRYAAPVAVLYDRSERVYKMWYRCLGYHRDSADFPDRFAYALSLDGIVWEKPELGLVDFGKTRRNNLLPPPGPYGEVFQDLREKDASRRFKTLGYARKEARGKAGVCISFSPDGLHWTPAPGDPLFTDFGSAGTYKRIGETHSLFGWDPPSGKYLAFMTPSGDFRNIGRSESDDFVHWSLPHPVLVPDEEDPPGTQFYGMSVFRDRGLYFGLLSVYHANSLMVDVELAYSRDGIGWRRLGKGQPILTYGLPDSFDSHGLHALKPLIRGDRIWVYYVGESESHALTPSDIPFQTHASQLREAPLNSQSWLKKRQAAGDSHSGVAMASFLWWPPHPRPK